MSLCSSPPHLLGLFDSPLSRGFGSRGHQVVTITRRTRDEGRSCHWAGRARMKDDDMGAGCHQGGTLALRGTPEWEATSVFFGPYFLFLPYPMRAYLPWIFQHGWSERPLHPSQRMRGILIINGMGGTCPGDIHVCDTKFADGASMELGLAGVLSIALGTVE